MRSYVASQERLGCLGLEVGFDPIWDFQVILCYIFRMILSILLFYFYFHLHLIFYFHFCYFQCRIIMLVFRTWGLLPSLLILFQDFMGCTKIFDLNYKKRTEYKTKKKRQKRKKNEKRKLKERDKKNFKVKKKHKRWKIWKKALKRRN